MDATMFAPAAMMDRQAAMMDRQAAMMDRQADIAAPWLNFKSAATGEAMDNAMQRVKSSLTLDFSNLKRSSIVFNDVLSSPDLGLLKLATPDLDKFILQHHQERKLSETPTPTQIYFPSSVTEEQEAYARGFVDALLDLQCKQEVVAGGLAIATQTFDFTNDSLGVACDPSINQSNLLQNYDGQKTESVASSFNAEPHSAIYREEMNYLASCSFAREQQKDHASQRHDSAVHKSAQGNYYPCSEYRNMTQINTQPSKMTAIPPITPMGVDTPPISPIDMVQQEVIKLQRKRARNRLAATRCRNRKLERIAILQGRVNDLKGENSKLTRTAFALRQIVSRMREEIMDHANRGCRLLTHHPCSFDDIPSSTR